MDIRYNALRVSLSGIVLASLLAGAVIVRWVLAAVPLVISSLTHGQLAALSGAQMLLLNNLQIFSIHLPVIVR
ncbi:MAG: hypothetical protein PVG14_13275 [Anaerolineales bacterium]|jgi:hypothetical protein